jgi:AcrR family transcriptional regulator
MPTANREQQPQGSDRTHGRPRDERIAAAVKTAVIAILNDKGYRALTMEEVAARAGTSKPALRRRWRSLQHIAVDALLDAAGPSPTPDTGCTRCDLVEGVGTLSRAFTGALVGRRVLPGLVADLAHDPELETEFFERFFHPRRASTAAALRRGIERGDLRPDADIDLLLDMLGSTFYYRALFGHLPVNRELAENVVDMVLAGVATEAWRSEHCDPPR